jgi:hypothetical protein
MSIPQDPLVFLLRLITTGPCVFNCISHFISQRLHSFTQVATQNHVINTLMLHQEECWFMSTRLGLFLMPLRDFRNVWPTSNNKQWTWLMSMPGVIPLLGHLFFPSFCWLSDLVFFKPFLTVSQRLQAFLQDTPINRSIQFCSSNRPTKARRSCLYPFPLSYLNTPVQQEIQEYWCPVPIYIYIKAGMLEWTKGSHVRIGPPHLAGILLETPHHLQEGPHIASRESRTLT